MNLKLIIIRKIITKFIKNYFMEIDHLIQHFQEIIKCYEENQKTEAKDFNVFDFMSEIFGLGETKHSRIIAFLLNRLYVDET